MKKENETRNQVTSEERRIKREEDLCWRQYWKEKKAQETKAQAEIEAAFKQMEQEPVVDIKGTDVPVKESREKGNQRRKNARSSKKRTKKNAAVAEANMNVRIARDQQGETHRDGPKRSQVLRGGKLIKRADKIAPKKK